MVTMVLRNASDSAPAIMRQFGWASEEMLEHYSRNSVLLDGTATADGMVRAVADSAATEEIFLKFGDPMSLPCAF